MGNDLKNSFASKQNDNSVVKQYHRNPHFHQSEVNTTPGKYEHIEQSIHIYQFYTKVTHQNVIGSAEDQGNVS